MSAPEFGYTTWVRKAEHDVICFERIMKEEPVPWDSVCFHAQQCGEKYLKAFLAFKGIEPLRIHDMPVLLQTCVDHDLTLQELRNDCQLLAPYSITRYPSRREPDQVDAQKALAAARSEILKRLPATA
jgi:HEPN domain-containing protein